MRAQQRPESIFYHYDTDTYMRRQKTIASPLPLSQLYCERIFLDQADEECHRPPDPAGQASRRRACGWAGRAHTGRECRGRNPPPFAPDRQDFGLCLLFAPTERRSAPATHPILLRTIRYWGRRRNFFGLADGVGFEPTIPFWGIRTFQARAFDRSATHPTRAALYLG